MKKLIALSVIIAVVLSASAMMGMTYVKVSDTCNKCSITDGGGTRKCGQCGGFLNGGKFDVLKGNWLQADFTCNKCGHKSTWKYKNK